ncbi:MAG: polyprenyl synthetase family protein [Planctomycetota bacterium]
MNSGLGIIDNELALVKKLLIEQLNRYSESAFVNDVLRHFQATSGKMFRPRLVLLSGLSCGEISEKHILVAAIQELIHDATLLHDDVIDDGQKRRGQATVNKLCGNELAVLLGDLLLSCAFRMCSELDSEIIGIIAETASRVCEGEIMQTQQRRNWKLTEAEYLDIITEKSAVFFRNCCFIGAKLSDAIEAASGALADFGLNLGIAFQITDDLLDMVGDENQTGKTLGSDVNNNLTLAVIHLLASSPEGEKDSIREKLISAAGDRKRLSDILKSGGALEYSSRKAKYFSEKAVSALEPIPSGPAKDSLIEIAGYVASRV